MQEYLTRLWLTESEQATPVDSIKDVVQSSVKVPEFDKHLKKAEGHIGRNVVENNNKDEGNSPKTLNDKNHQATSQKFRQLMYVCIYNWKKNSADSHLTTVNLFQLVTPYKKPTSSNGRYITERKHYKKYSFNEFLLVKKKNNL